MRNAQSQQSAHPRGRPPQTAEPPPPPRLGSRVLGWSLMALSLGLVSCQSLFVL
ncbi:hypothetical protein [Thiohalocapsa halophila]|uniref:hypothetical protein n=1 Tax=Thiohalocapsa halophila TaxID=69359 RepID=UPI001907F211|nr:hypothetical protein [Thiohalocapsa halophila]